MADTAVPVTAGSGTNIDTRTEGTNGNHRQVVVLGDPSTNAGVAPVDATAGLKVDLGADNDVAVSSIAAGDNNIGNVDIASIAAGDNNIGNVDIVSGTITTVSTVSQNSDVRQSTASNLNAQVVGSIAHDAADSGNPVKVGAKAGAALSGETLVSADDRTDLQSDLDGAVIIRKHGALGDIVKGIATITDGSSTSVISAAGSGVKIYITDVIISNSSASTFGTVDLRDGTGGSVLATFPVPGSGGVVHRFETPLMFSANTAVAADPSAAISSIVVTLLGFKSKI